MKYLYRSKKDRKIAGICAGLAHYFSLDPSLVRIVWLCFVFLGGTGFLLYLICWLIIPESSTEEDISCSLKPLMRSKTNKVIAGVCGGIGQYFELDPVLVRVAFIMLTILAGWGILLYVVLWIAMRKES